jgi:hypothetical protein
MFQYLPDYFTLPDEKNKDLYDLYKNGIVGARTSCFIVITRKAVPLYDPRNTTILNDASLSSASTPMHFIYGQSCRTCRADISFSEKKKQASGGEHPEGMNTWPSIGWSGKLCSPFSPSDIRVTTPKN